MTQHSIQVALELAHKPWLARQLRSRPVPGDILELIKLAAGCNETCDELQKVTGRSPETLREVATHYLHVVLFFPGASSTRILGLPGDATRAIMLQHKRWLIKWLHPDRNGDVWESAHMARVLMAWNDLNSEAEPPGRSGLDISMVEKSVEAPIVRRKPASPAIAASHSMSATPRAPASRVGQRRFGIAVMIVFALVIAGSGGVLFLQEVYRGAADASIIPDSDLARIGIASPTDIAADRCTKRALVICNADRSDP